jgi:hypothetical protein
VNSWFQLALLLILIDGFDLPWWYAVLAILFWLLDLGTASRVRKKLEEVKK